MGGTQSVPLHYVPDDFPFMCLTLTWSSTSNNQQVPQESVTRQRPCLWTTYAGDADIQLCRRVITSHWQSGIREESKRFSFGYEFLLNIFTEDDCSEEQHIQKLVCMLFGSLLSSGWSCLTSTDISRLQDTVTWVLQRCEQRLPTAPGVQESASSGGQGVGCISITQGREIHVVNLPSHLHTSLLESVMRVCAQSYQTVRYDNTTGTYIIQLVRDAAAAAAAPASDSAVAAADTANKRRSSSASSTDTNSSPRTDPAPGLQLNLADLLLEIIAQMRKFGWAPLTSCNLGSATDSMLFQHAGGVAATDVFAEHTSAAAPLFALSLFDSNQIRIFGAANTDIDNTIRQAVKSVSKSGLKKESRRPSGYLELKLKGSPWRCSGSDNIRSKLIMVKILEALQAHGWSVLTTIHVRSAHFMDKTVLIFERCAPQSSPFFCLSMTGADTIGMLNTSEGVVQLCRDILHSKWSWEVRQEKCKGQLNCWEWRLNRKPWSAGCGPTETGYHARALLCLLLEQFYAQKWTVVMSADVASKLDDGGSAAGTTDPHTWFFHFNPNALSGDSPSRQPPQHRASGSQNTSPHASVAATGPPAAATPTAPRGDDVGGTEPPTYDETMKASQPVED